MPVTPREPLGRECATTRKLDEVQPVLLSKLILPDDSGDHASGERHVERPAEPVGDCSSASQKAHCSGPTFSEVSSSQKRYIPKHHSRHQLGSTVPKRHGLGNESKDMISDRYNLRPRRTNHQLPRRTRPVVRTPKSGISVKALKMHKIRLHQARLQIARCRRRARKAVDGSSS